MIKGISGQERDLNEDRICDGCGSPIGKDDIWYPFFDISRCGGGILYLDARCAVERVISVADDKQDLMERVAQAVRHKDDPLSDGMTNFYYVFPISPIHWIQGYAIGGDLEEIDILTKVNAQHPSHILIVEGKDDIAILQQFLAKTGLDLARIVLTTGAHKGGWEDAVRTVEFLKRIQLHTPYLIILDSDGDPEKKLNALAELGVPTENALVLKEKEIEAYILDAEALGSILAADSNEVASRLTEIKATGKEKLEAVFKSYGLSAPNAQVKGLIAHAMPSVPQEITELARRITVATS
jgi:5S rRNA maturation endonuclease (ribonuclease M5)